MPDFYNNCFMKNDGVAPPKSDRFPMYVDQRLLWNIPPCFNVIFGDFGFKVLLGIEIYIKFLQFRVSGCNMDALNDTISWNFFYLYKMLLVTKYSDSGH